MDMSGSALEWFPHPHMNVCVEVYHKIISCIPSSSARSLGHTMVSSGTTVSVSSVSYPSFFSFDKSSLQNLDVSIDQELPLDYMLIR